MLLPARPDTRANVLLSLERISVLPDGRIAYLLRKPRRNGATHLVMTPVQFLARISGPDSARALPVGAPRRRVCTALALVGSRLHRPATSTRSSPSGAATTTGTIGAGGLYATS